MTMKHTPTRTLRGLTATAALLATVPAMALEDGHAAADQLALEAAALLPPAKVEVAAAVGPDECSTLGQWSSVIAWTPHVPVSAANLPDGRILTFASNKRTTFPVGPEFTYAATWNPATGQFQELNHGTHDMFCGGITLMPDGRVFVNGGRNTTSRSSVFDWRNNTWARVADMTAGRWYNTTVSLPNGQVWTVSGSGGSYTAERWAPNAWTRLTGINWATVTAEPGYINIWHPFIQVAPDGRLFHYGPTDTMHWITTDGTGTLASANLFVPGAHYPKEGSHVMYDEGKILVAGGGETTAAMTGSGFDGTSGTSSRLAYTVDLNTNPPTVATTASMANARQYANVVMLPSGEALVMGGNAGRKFNDTGSILTPEIWNPRTGTWRPVAQHSVPRNYHSVALLLPDGRVWLGGGGLGGNAADHPDAQLYTPPCLFNADGSAAVRPALTTAPAKIGPGSVFTVQGTAGIAKFAFIKMSALTHSVNTDLRHLTLPFTETSPGNYAVTARPNLNVMTPGYWMLFGIGQNGAHSVSKIVQVDSTVTVQIASPGPQTHLAGNAVTVAVTASGPNGVAKSFAATGLPPGASINASTGVISGSLTTAGNFTPTVTVTASGISASATFPWVVLTADGLGGLKREWWLNIPGATLADLTSSAAYPASPAGTDTLTSFETPADWADDLGQRVRGWLQPTVSGQYRFFIASDDEGRLLLSTDQTPEKAVAIASVPSWSGPREWTKFPQQQSSLVTLQAGRRYYIEALMKEGAGGDNLAVAWQPPGASTPAVIPGANLSTYAASPANRPPTLTAPSNRTNVTGTALTLSFAASDPDGNALTFGATNLPPGLGINTASGLISGTPTTAGTWNVTLSVTDGLAAPVTGAFTWTINTPLALNALTTNPIPSGTSVTFTAQSSGGVNAKYSWNFGDGTASTAFSSNPAVSKTWSAPGRYEVTLTVRDDTGRELSTSFFQAIHPALTAAKPAISSPIAYEVRAAGNARLWVCNPDNDSVTVFDAVTRAKLGEINVGTSPRSLAVAPDGRVWVVNHQSATLSIINGSTLAVAQTVTLPRASRPFGLAFDPDKTDAWIALEGTGQLLRLNPATAAVSASIAVGQHARHVSVSADSATVFVSRFITPRLPGEDTATVQTTIGGTNYGGEVLVVNPASNAIASTIILRHSEALDTPTSARGIPNYLGPVVISPDGVNAWVPSKQDNVKRGTLRSGDGLTHDQAIRMIASRLNLATGAEDLASRVDYDNAGIPSTAAFDPRGVYLFTALEGSREIAVTDAFAHHEVARITVQDAPQGLVLSPDGNTLFVHNFMARTVTVHDLTDLMRGGEAEIGTAATLPTVTTEKLSATVLKGKKLFYDARDERLSFQQYISCASCHNDGAQDGRVWDFTGFGEGLRNTITLRGHGGTAQGPLHWSGNFDEVQDFEGQIRNFALGTGLMADADFHAGTRSTPLGTPKAGLSADLDALAAYVASLNAEDPNPHRNADGSMTAAAIAGKDVFRTQNCAQCHGGPQFTNSALNLFANVGTLKPTSGKRLGGALTGFDIPTLRGLWNTGPYLHDGSAPTLTAAVQAHQGVTLNATDLNNLVAYLTQIDATETSAPAPSAPTVTLTAPASSTGAFNVSVASSAALTGLTASDFVLTNGTAGALTGSGSAWTLAVTPVATGNVTVRLPAAAAVTASNVGNLASNTTTTAYQANRAPVLTQPADQSTQRGTAVSLQLSASDPDGNTLTWTATGLPTGLAISPGSGLISGMVSTSAAASSTATVTVSDGALSASKSFTWATTAPPPVDTPVAGLKGEYFANATLAGTPALTRVDGILFNYWPEASSPGAGVPGDNFSVRWTGRLKPPTSETYTFYLDVDDGARVWVNGQLILDKWNPVPDTYFDVASSPVALTANQLVDLKVEYQDFFSDAYVVLKWQTASRPRDIIPASAYFQPVSGPDTTAPTVALTTTSATVTGLFDVAVAASEAVTGLTASDFIVTNAAVGALTGSGGTYSLRLTPTAAGAVTVRLPAAACADSAGNASAASNTLSVTYAPPVANRVPVVTAIPAQASDVNAVVTLQVQATDPDGQTLVYSATGLPLGLSISGNTGLISGRVSATAGSTNNVTVSVSDGIATTTRQFIWTINAAPPAQGLLGEYFTGQNLGSLVLTRTDDTVDFYWPEGTAPASGLPHDYFSVRWTGEITPQFSETYRFHADCDDGVRIWVNGTLVLDHWNPEPATYFGLQSSAIALTAGQPYSFRVEFQDFFSDAYVQVRWSSPSQPQQVIPKTRLTPARRNGLTARYFNGRNFETQVLERIDAEVNHYWNTSSPATGVSSDGFSVRWTGCVVPPTTGTWSFHLTSDDGTRLWINDTLVIDNWTNPVLTEVSGSITLPGGEPAMVKLEYFENTGAARCELRWSSATLAKQIIPASRLLVNENTAPELRMALPAVENLPGAAVSAAFTNFDATARSLQLTPEPDGRLTLGFECPLGLGLVVPYAVEASSDGKTWTPVAASPVITDLGDGWERLAFPNIIDPRQQKKATLYRVALRED